MSTRTPQQTNAVKNTVGKAHKGSGGNGGDDGANGNRCRHCWQPGYSKRDCPHLDEDHREARAAASTPASVPPSSAPVPAQATTDASGPTTASGLLAGLSNFASSLPRLLMPSEPTTDPPRPTPPSAPLRGSRRRGGNAGRGRSIVVCRLCGGFGHISTECPGRNNAARRNGLSRRQYKEQQRARLSSATTPGLAARPIRPLPPPGPAPSSISPPPVPEGWTAHFDVERRSWFYVGGGRSQWELPTAPPIPPTPIVPQGWTARWDLTARSFYYASAHGVQWELPLAAAVTPPPPPLPTSDAP
ncbi:hypothetical protein FSARC_14475 [Fusarium sarcochroum]|uniref:CCHC-type domain-containing protein n=1 Tax=Fusarium sarcochroum TaxID=1208366 RepID=A0A8H4WNU3_9HYPO|nr:hypothetical protein FSARC_14475 [Fusarium sarcochroum]